MRNSPPADGTAVAALSSSSSDRSLVGGCTGLQAGTTLETCIHVAEIFAEGVPLLSVTHLSHVRRQIYFCLDILKVGICAGHYRLRPRTVFSRKTPGSLGAVGQDEVKGGVHDLCSDCAPLVVP